MPLYNESNRYKYDHWFKILNENLSVNFLFVDDNSTENSDYLLNLKNKFKNFHYVKLNENQGKANAIRHGLMLANNSADLGADIFGYIDFDDSILHSEVQRLIHLICNLNNSQCSIDTVWATRVKLNGRVIRRSNIRHFFSRILITLIGLNYPDLPYDSQCGLKLFFKSEHLLSSLTYKFRTRWFIDLELLIRMTKLKKEKLNIWEEPLLHWTEIKSFNYNFASLIKILFDVFYICKEIRKIRKY